MRLLSVCLTFLTLSKWTGAFLFHQDLVDPKDDYAITLGESFFFANGRYQYSVQCAFETPGERRWDRVGLYVYASLGPLIHCFTCVHGSSGTATTSKENFCRGDGSELCNAVQSEVEVHIPYYANNKGKVFYADFSFPGSSSYSWKELSSLYVSCWGIDDDTGRSTQSDPINANPTIWGLGWDYSNWIHWIIAIVIIIASIQVLGFIGELTRKSKNKNIKFISQVFICQKCLLTKLSKGFKGKKKKKKKSKK